MILAVDIGNSNIVMGCLDEDYILFEERLKTDIQKSADDYYSDINKMLAGKGIDPFDVEDAIVSTVVPQLLGTIQTALHKLTGKLPLVVGPGLKTNLEVKLDDPSQIGADLVVVSVAARAEYETPVIVIDMGTATTVTVVDRDGAFLGGSICPGVGISLDALTERTALLPDMELEQPSRAIGRNTLDCMRSGVVLGAACMLDGLIQRMEEELGCEATVVATGGIAGFIVPLCRHPIHYDKDLLLKGLAILYRENEDI